MATFGLIGRHLGHSFSRRYFTEKFLREGLTDHAYQLFELEDIAELPGLIERTPGLVGLNVTIPYKQAVIPLVHALDPVAAAVGAVNTLHIQGGRVTGYNTDVEGVRATLLPLLGGETPPALVLGTGGASRAVVHVLAELGIPCRVVGRRGGPGELIWDQVDDMLVGACPLIINTTPLGMFPAVEGIPPIPMNAIGHGHHLVDLVYNPEETRFLRVGRMSGARTVNGMRMLHAQAEAGWSIWKGRL